MLELGGRGLRAACENALFREGSVRIVATRGGRGIFSRVRDDRTTAAVQRCLDELAGPPGDGTSESVVRALLARATDRLHQLCSSLLYRSYPRLTRGPLNFETEELLNAVVARLIKAMREVRPATVRQFFGLAAQHMRWELNDVARRLDRQGAAEELRESRVTAPPSATSPESDSSNEPSAGLERIVAAIEGLPADEREALDLVRLQGLTQPEAAQIVGVSARTVQRRLNRALVLLSETLGDLERAGPPA